jgi:hypothetical protein
MTYWRSRQGGGILLIILTCLVVCLARYAATKHATRVAPVLMLLWFRYLFQALTTASALARAKDPPVRDAQPRLSGIARRSAAVYQFLLFLWLAVSASRRVHRHCHAVTIGGHCALAAYVLKNPVHQSALGADGRWADLACCWWCDQAAGVWLGSCCFLWCWWALTPGFRY